MGLETAFLLMFGVAILTGVSSLFTKKSLISIHAAQFQTGRAIIDLFFLVVLAPFLLEWPGWTAIGITAFLGLILSISQLYVIKAIRHSNIGEVFPLFNFSPFFLVVFAFIFLGERIHSLQYLGIGLLMFGAYFLQVKKHDYFRPFKMLHNRYFVFVMFAMVVYSATATMEKSFLGILIAPITYLWWVKLFQVIFYMIYDFSIYDAREMKGVIKKSWKDISAVAGIGWVSLGMAYTAFPMAPISVLIPIKRSSTLFSTVMGGKMFQDDHLLQHVIACIIMLIGVVLVVL